MKGSANDVYVLAYRCAELLQKTGFPFCGRCLAREMNATEATVERATDLLIASGNYGASEDACAFCFLTTRVVSARREQDTPQTSSAA